jgi:hydrogenase maturation protease
MKKEAKNKIIVIGIGNIGRQDDGLGWEFLDFLKKEGLPNVNLECRYQLQIEDAELICRYDTVIFVDAVKDHLKKEFYYKICEPSDKFSFSTHALVPETILFLAKKLYGHSPKAYVLGIRGYQWDLNIGLSKKAIINFNNAKNYFMNDICHNL